MLIAGRISSVVPVKLPVAPLGSPDTVRLTEPVKPLTGVTVIVSLPFTFCASLSVPVAAASVNDPGAEDVATTNVTVAVCLRPFEVAVALVVPVMTMG